SQRPDGRGRSAVALATLDAAPRARLAPLADRSRACRQVARAARLRAPAPPRRLADPPGHVLERARRRRVSGTHRAERDVGDRGTEAVRALARVPEAHEAPRLVAAPDVPVERGARERATGAAGSDDRFRHSGAGAASRVRV